MDKPRSTLAQIRQERLDKVEKIKQLGIEPYPSKVKRDAKIKEVTDGFAEYENKTVTLAGRLVSKREHGNLYFGHIQDQYGQIQLFIKSDEIAPTSKKKQIIGFEHLGLVDVGDIVQATGVVTKTKAGEISLLVKEFKLLTKAIRPLPDKHQGIKDKETLFRQRYLDMIMNPEKRKNFELSAKILYNIRAFMDQKGFLEIKTPIIQPVYGGSTAKPFMTHVNALGEDYYLAIAHELYLKRLIVAGFENVYNIVGYFRNEGIDRTHNPEFNMLETMSAYNNYEYNMDLTEEMYKFIAKNVFDRYNFNIKGRDVDLQKPWSKLTMLEAVKKYANYDFDQVKTIEEAHKILDEIGYKDEKPKSIGESMFKVFEEKVEEHLIEPVFIYGHPVEISPLAKQMSDDKRFVERFEVFMGGMEAGDNWTELNDPVELFDRFKDQHDRKVGGDEEAHPMDIEFIEAMEYGMPPTTGLGPGIERLCMMFTETEYLDDVVFFPMLKPAPVTKIQKEIYGEEYVGLNGEAKASNQKSSKNLLSKKLDLVTISNEVKQKFPGIKLGYVVLEGVNVDRKNSDLEALKTTIVDSVEKQYENIDEMRNNPHIKGFREIYKATGVDPNSRMNSAEALLRRIIKGKGLYNVNTVVDTYNVTSAEAALPMAAYDLDKVEGNFTLRLSKQGEEMTKIGEDEPTISEDGELVYADEKGITCIDLNYRDSDRTKITEKTKRIIVFVDGHQDVEDQKVLDTLNQVANRLQKYTGGKVVGYGTTWKESGSDNTQESFSTEGTLPSKSEALEILEKYVEDEYQRLHAKMVAAALEDLSSKYEGEDPNLWYITGLLHDLDFDKHPDEHPHTELEWFKEWGYPEALIHAVAAHAFMLTDVMPKTVLANAILAVDEFSGLLYAYSKMKGGRFDDMKIKSVKKKFKDKSFAAKIDRGDVQKGIDGLGIEFGELVESLTSTFSSMKEFGGDKDYLENSGNVSTANSEAPSGKQDMSKKIVIVVNEELENWKIMNTVGHISAYLGNKIDQSKFHSGQAYKTKNGEAFDRSGQYPIVVLKTSGKGLRKLKAKSADSQDLISYPFLKEHLEVEKDEDINEALKNKSSEELAYYGIGLWGDREKLDELTGKYSLWN
ncbi:lysine--tRNA ligase [Candidatus Dojkabacteria bacterium]|nr:lysine--tRNA ligase [Candidatus Dojkabacteria bacterium]